MNNNKQPITKDSQESEEKKILEHMPYLNLLIEDIRELNRALRDGKTGITETEILLNDIPEKWYAEIQLQCVKAKQALSIEEKKRDFEKRTGTSGSHKRKAEDIYISHSHDYTNFIKRTVITLLDTKDILLLTKKCLSGKSFKIDDNEDDEDE